MEPRPEPTVIDYEAPYVERATRALWLWLGALGGSFGACCFSCFVGMLHAGLILEYVKGQGLGEGWIWFALFCSVFLAVMTFWMPAAVYLVSRNKWLWLTAVASVGVLGGIAFPGFVEALLSAG